MCCFFASLYKPAIGIAGTGRLEVEVTTTTLRTEYRSHKGDFLECNGIGRVIARRF